MKGSISIMTTMPREKKYGLTGETMVITHPLWPQRQITLHRIMALKAIPLHNVRAHELGGWIQSEDNLTQAGQAWVADNSMVFDQARCMVNAITKQSACLYGNAIHRGASTLTGSAQQRGHSQTSGTSTIGGNTIIEGKAEIMGTWEDHGSNLIDRGVYRENAQYQAPTYDANSYVW
jgi:bacterial transferase hexapeptide repeat protein